MNNQFRSVPVLFNPLFAILGTPQEISVIEDALQHHNYNHGRPVLMCRAHLTNWSIIEFHMRLIPENARR